MRTVIVALAVCLALAGCGADRPVSGLRVMVPNNPGSGYDVTARSAALVVEDAGLARSVEVFNLPGAGGTIGLQRLVNERGNGALLMQMGLGVVGAVHTARSPVSFADTTPIARLTEDAETVVVAADSPYRSLAELTTAWRADPARMPVAGGSSSGRAGPPRGPPARPGRRPRSRPRRLPGVRRWRRPARRGPRAPGRVRGVELDGVPRPDRRGTAAGARGHLRGAGARRRRTDAARGGRRPAVRQLARSGRAAGTQPRPTGAR